MDTLEAIRNRRSVKHYDASFVIPEEDINSILDLAMQSPTAFNIQHWRFVLVRDPELRKEVRAAAWNQAQVTDASLLIIMTGDLKAWERETERYWRNAPKEVAEFMIPAIDAYYRDKPQVQRDEVFRTCGIAAQTIMLAAKAMGYDSCPMDGFDFDAVGKLINLPEDHVITKMIAIGKGVKAPWPKPGQLGMNQVVITDRF